MAEQCEKKVMGQSVPDLEWLAKVQEPALEPDLPIVDPHHHLWVRSGANYLVLDLTLGERARDIFEQHLNRSGGRFRGVRYSTAWDASERINNVAPRQHQLIEPEVLAAAGMLADMGLGLDCWLYHRQLSDVSALADKHPGLTIILNHTGVPILGGPYRDKRDQVFEDWKAGMADVAKRPNVYLKLGALPILRGADVDRSLPRGSEEIAAAWKPWMDYCITTFGPARCMFESNFPVQKLWSSYGVTWNAFKRLAAGASAGEKQALFEGAARAAYRLP